MIANTITPNSVNLLLRGRMRTISDTHVNFHAVREALKNYAKYPSPELEERIAGLVDIPTFIAKVTEGRVKISDTEVYFDDKPVHGVIASRLLSMLSQGFNVRPLARFLERIRSNTIPTAEDEMYLWMEGSNLPLTDDGCFLAFKKVQDDYKSYHDGKTDNSIGTKLPLLDASNYDTNRYRTCSSGYHFCSFKYLSSYYGDRGRVVICKVAPEDVVSIPSDYGNAKGRAKTYEIIGEVPEDEAAQFFTSKPVVNSFGTYEGDDAVAVEEREDSEDVSEAVEDPAVTDDKLDGFYGLSSDYFGESNSLRQMHLRAQVPFNKEAMTKFVDNDDTDAVPMMFPWVDEPQGVRFWSNIYDNIADEFEHHKGRHIVSRYLDIMFPGENVPDGVFVFTTSDGRELGGSEIARIVDAHGQRGASRLLNVPRTTLQDWLKKLLGSL